MSILSLLAVNLIGWSSVSCLYPVYISAGMLLRTEWAKKSHWQEEVSDRRMYLLGGRASILTCLSALGF